MSARGAFGGLLIGTAIGAILAILFAPEKGVKTRKRLGKLSDEWSGRAVDAFGNAGEVVEKGRKKLGI